MVNLGEGGRAEAFSAHWRVSVVGHARRTGRPPYEQYGAGDVRPLASRDGLRIHGGVGRVRCVDASGRTRWTHHCEGRPNAAHITGGRVLVTTDSLEYTPWGHLGPALLLDLSDGTQIAELRGERGAALRGGRFLLGLEGYDFFDTWEYDRGGVLTDSWRSYGHYVVGTGIRVVETDRNIPTGSRVVRLLPGGVVERGPHLTSPTAPRPLVLEDGTILVLDAGVLRAVDRGLGATVLAELLPSASDEASGRTEALRRDGEYITAVIAEPHPGRPSRHTVHTWTMTLHPPRT
ncbi:hypothetical protein ACGFYQ_35960 [Streptomyces sp. NPDC048258]|uniref:hypothetical protein n=1 Tax=Streptomyces sp. NPDC048258 TaxID=3365527 RepID=UPI0037113E44